MNLDNKGLFAWIRPHRALLDASMAEAEEIIRDKEFLEEYIRIRGWGIGPVPDGVVTTKPYGGVDKRTGWDTYMVLLDGRPWGFMDGDIE